jgi:glucosamine--fructose-6-phosphate aminotransferase (isomerizing)
MPPGRHLRPAGHGRQRPLPPDRRASGQPLVIGVGENEYIAASDISALISHTRQVIYLEDGEIAELTLTGYRTSTFWT